MNLDEILDSLDELLDKSWSLPLAGGRSVIDVEKVRDHLDEIRLNLPSEIKQAKAIVIDRNDIINGAKKEAETLVKRAEERSKALLSEQEIYKTAQAKANEILTTASKQAREMKGSAKDFADATLANVEESMAKCHAEVKQARATIKASK